MRQVVLDTETTGLEPKLGHKIIEIGCVELIDRRLTGRHYHQYINPAREIDQGAIDVHGITNEFLVDKPLFNVIAAEFLAFVSGAELVIHNAPFDTGFINHEFSKIGLPPIETACTVLDTLALARHKHPGQKNNLDALCRRYGIDNSHRDLHGALLDSEILADVYLLMTGGQRALQLSESDETEGGGGAIANTKLQNKPMSLKVIRATESELGLHQGKLEEINKKSEGCLWLG